MLTILIVEDERDVRIGLRVLLEDEGYRVVEAASVAEALAALDREPPDLFLVDVKLPDGRASTSAAPCATAAWPPPSWS